MKLTVLLLLIATPIAGAQPIARLEALRGKVMPDFRLRDLVGRESYFRRLRGKVVLINFWSPT